MPPMAGDRRVDYHFVGDIEMIGEMPAHQARRVHAEGEVNIMPAAANT